MPAQARLVGICGWFRVHEHARTHTQEHICRHTPHTHSHTHIHTHTHLHTRSYLIEWHIGLNVGRFLFRTAHILKNELYTHVLLWVCVHVYMCMCVGRFLLGDLHLEIFVLQGTHSQKSGLCPCHTVHRTKSFLESSGCRTRTLKPSGYEPRHTQMVTNETCTLVQS